MSTTRFAPICFVLIATAQLNLFSISTKYKESGIPVYTIYNLEELDVGLSTLKLSEDSVGRILVYEDGNIFTFNGRNWNNQLDKNASSSSVIVSLKEAKNGRIYAGAIGDWGELVPQNNGLHTFKSLAMGIDRSWASTNRFSLIVTEKNGAVFVGETAIVRYNKTENNRVWSWLNAPSDAFSHNENTYIATQTDGVFMPRGEQLISVPLFKDFVGEKAIFNHVKLSNGDLILGTRSEGLFRYDGNKIERIKTQIDHLLVKSLSDIEIIENKYFALAVKGHGIFFLDSEFNLLSSIEKRLDGSFVSSTDIYYQDGGILWASIPNGIAKIIFPTPISLIDERMGAFLLWPKLQRHNDKLYISSNGDFYQAIYDEKNNIRNFSPIKIPGSPIIRCASMTDNGIVYCKENNIYQYDQQNDNISLIAEGITGNLVKKVDKFPNHLIILGANFHQLLKIKDGKWIPVGEKKKSSGYSCVSLQSAQGDVWIEHGINRIARIIINEDGIEVIEYNGIENLPEGWINIWKYKDTTYLTCGGKIAAFDSETQSFIQDKKPEWMQDEMIHEVVRPTEDVNGNIWISSGGKIFIMNKTSNGFIRDNSTLQVIKENQQEIFLDKNGAAFIYSKNRIFKYDPSVELAPPRLQKPVIDLIRIVKNNRIIYSAISPFNKFSIELPYRENGLVFSYFSPSYSQGRQTKFSYKLEGLNDEWSEPSGETSVSFNNLYEGNYVFHIRTIDLNGTSTHESSYRFQISPPVYRNTYAYLIYILLSLLLLYLIIKWTVRKSELKRQKLEILVSERTEELDATNHQLKEALLRAEQAKNAKTRFLANMSHEIRTPMNGVVGMSEILKNTPLNSEQEEIVNIIGNSSNILLGVINDILDFTRIESGNFELEKVSFSPAKIVYDTLDMLGMFAEKRNITFFANIPTNMPVKMLGDSNRISQILVNLANNALKFTSDGEVQISLKTEPDKDRGVILKIAVADTGIGIPKNKMACLFQSFSQVAPSDSRLYGGSGLGLAICKKLTEIMKGKIYVSSEVGKGSTFTVEIPIEIPHIEQLTSSPILNGKSIIYVDSCENRQRAVGVFFEFHKIKFHVASNMDTCLERMDQLQSIDFIVFDENPSPLKWENFTQSLKTQSIQQPRILVYKLPLEKLPAQLMVQSITKPIKQAALIETLEKLEGVDFMQLELDNAERNGEEHTEVTKRDHPLQILLVEDNIVNQKVCSLMLRRINYTCKIANDGIEALDLLAEQSFDLVLMDIQMPRLNGFETAKRIRKSQEIARQPKIIALTAGTMENEYERALSAGMNGLIAKPIVMEELFKTVRKVEQQLSSTESAES